MKPAYLKVIILLGLLSIACTTKVSEWVLLNSEANMYTLVYFHKDPVPEIIQKQNDELGKTISTANIQFTSLKKDNIDQPYFALYYKNRLFNKYTDYKELRNLTTSSLREKIASELMAGKLCVMLYLKTDDKVKDDKGIQALQNALNSSPFKEVITIVELSKNNIEETHFVSMLLNVESDLKTIKEPMLFGIFGRFKALEPLLGGGITEENINLMVHFLTADCSCLIKDDLPGTDMLFTNDWDSPEPALVNKIIDANPSLEHM
jgi:hypothetical protein